MFHDFNIVSCALSPDHMTVRVDDPNEALAAIGCGMRTYTRKSVVPGVSDGTVNVLILQRPMFEREQGWTVVRQSMANGWLVVLEFDDHIDLIPSGSRNQFLSSFGTDIFRICHGVQTTTPVLEAYFRQFNPNVRGFPNQIFRYPTRPKPKSEKTRIFFGAHNRRSSWQPLMETFNKVLAGRDDIQFCVAGDEGFFEALDVRDKTVIPSKDYSVYMNALHASDIVLSPLEPSPQTNGKSDIKFLEAAICGAAMIASPTVYGDTIVQGETGLIARTYSDWTNGLTALIEKPELRRRLAANAGLYVRQHRMLMQHIHKRTDWYRELWAKREETNARLRETFPELR